MSPIRAGISTLVIQETMMSQVETTASVAGTSSVAGSSPRLMSIDALRGFDMFWIMGADVFFRRLAEFLRPSTRAFVERQLEHADWAGFYFYDLIFPLFLFLVGVVIPFSMAKYVAQSGAQRSLIYARIGRRAVFLFALGLLCNGILRFDWSHLRIAGVLQRIAICYAAAALIYLNSRRLGRVFAVVIILVGYWAVLTYVAPPDSHPRDYSKETNLAGYVDRHYLPGKIMKPYYGYGDNEGLLSTVPAVATALIGVLAGEWLRSKHRPGIKVVGLIGAGALGLLVGLGWGGMLGNWYGVFPVIKNIWTSSFVLVAGGLSLLLLALFYLVIDVIGWRSWAFPFVVIGMNAITIYFVPHFIDFGFTARFFLSGALAHSGRYEPVVLAGGVLLAEWVFLYILYRQKIFLRA